MKCDSPLWVQVKNPVGRQTVPVPCGRCPPCKIRRVNSWVFRLLEEEKVSSSAFFVTLTYDTSTVPISDNGFMTLRKSDFQDYMKRLRKLCDGYTLKYYAVGEYGSIRSRPHYHAIVFNVPEAKFFADAWSLNGSSIGNVHVGNVSGDSIAYTMKYIDKAQYCSKRYCRDDRAFEFSLMSKGLGKSYFENPAIVKYHKADLSRLYCTKVGGYKIAMPKYYRANIYSRHEMQQQTDLIDAAMILEDVKSRKEHLRNYGDSDYTFDKALWNEKQGRIISFQTRLKKRDYE